MAEQTQPADLTLGELAELAELVDRLGLPQLWRKRARSSAMQAWQWGPIAEEVQYLLTERDHETQAMLVREYAARMGATRYEALVDQRRARRLAEQAAARGDRHQERLWEDAAARAGANSQIAHQITLDLEPLLKWAGAVLGWS